jgi:hypothetical protein
VDRLTALICVAQLKLRLEVLTRHPELLEQLMADKRPPLTIPRPVELAGMRARLLRAQGQQKELAQIGKDYDTVMDAIDEGKQVLKGHVGDLRMYEASVRSTIEGMIDRSNGAPPDGESDGRQSSSDHDGAGETATAEHDNEQDAVSQPTSSPAALPPAPTSAAASAGHDAIAATEQLTVNGVTRI